MATSISLPVACPFCLQEYHEPRRLPCGDAFCGRCILAHMIATTQNAEFLCPKCKQVCPAAEEHSIGTEFKKLFPKATDFIPESGGMKVEKCSKPGHKKELLTRYCKTHKTTLCSECEKTGHAKCTIVNLQDKIGQIRSNMTVLAENIDKYLSDVKRNPCSNQYKNQIWKLKTSVQKHAKKLRQAIDHEEKQLLAKLDGMKNEVPRMKLHEQRTCYTEVLQDVREMVDEAIEGDSSSQVLHVWKDIQETMKEWEDVALKFEVSTEERMRGCNKLLVGEISNSQSGKEHVPVHSSKFIENLKLKSRNRVVGLAVIRGYIVTMHLCERNLHISKPNGDCHKIVAIPKLKDPISNGSVVEIQGYNTTNIHLCVADRGIRALHLLSLTPEWDIEQTRMVELDYIPMGMNVSQGGNQIVVCGNRAIHIYSARVECLQDIPTDWYYGYSARKLCNGETVVAAKDESALFWINNRGNKLREFKTKDGVQDMYHPHYVTEDKEGNILVAYENGLQVLSQNGDFLEHIIRDGELSNPAVVHASDDGKVYVSNESNLKVISYNQNTYDDEKDRLEVNKKSLKVTLTLYT